MMARPRRTMVTEEIPRADVLDKLSFVIASSQREKVLGTVMPGPKTPVQVSKETGLRLPHVSRALSQLGGSGLVQLEAASTRGKLYSATSLGRAVFFELSNTRGDRVVAPMARGTHFKNYYHWVREHYGKDPADALFLEFGIDPSRIDEDGWYPLRTTIQVLETIEALFGDGSYETIRRMFHDEAGNFSSIQKLLSRVLPLSLLLELGAGYYTREFNHGRLEVEIKGRRALYKNYDWISSPARCAAWLGTYEGALRLTGHKAKVRKVACMLKGDPYCGYSIEW